MNTLSNHPAHPYPFSPGRDQHHRRGINLLSPLRRWLGQLDISHSIIAQTICRLIPAQCPFARRITWQGRTVMVIPPLCKLNPLYEDLMVLRFRALSYLADRV